MEVSRMRHVLSLEQQRAGVVAALRSRKTPVAFHAGLRQRLQDLDRQLGTRKRKRVKKPGFLGWFEW